MRQPVQGTTVAAAHLNELRRYFSMTWKVSLDKAKDPSEWTRTSLSSRLISFSGVSHQDVIGDRIHLEDCPESG